MTERPYNPTPWWYGLTWLLIVLLLCWDGYALVRKHL